MFNRNRLAPYPKQRHHSCPVGAVRGTISVADRQVLIHTGSCVSVWIPRHSTSYFEVVHLASHTATCCAATVVSGPHGSQHAAWTATFEACRPTHNVRAHSMQGGIFVIGAGRPQTFALSFSPCSGPGPRCGIAKSGCQVIVCPPAQLRTSNVVTTRSRREPPMQHFSFCSHGVQLVDSKIAAPSFRSRPLPRRFPSWDHQPRPTAGPFSIRPHIALSEPNLPLRLSARKWGPNDTVSLSLAQILTRHVMGPTPSKVLCGATWQTIDCFTPHSQVMSDLTSTPLLGTEGAADRHPAPMPPWRLHYMVTRDTNIAHSFPSFSQTLLEGSQASSNSLVVSLFMTVPELRLGSGPTTFPTKACIGISRRLIFVPGFAAENDPARAKPMTVPR